MPKRKRHRYLFDTVTFSNFADGVTAIPWRCLQESLSTPKNA